MSMDQKPQLGQHGTRLNSPTFLHAEPGICGVILNFASRRNLNLIFHGPGISALTRFR